MASAAHLDPIEPAFRSAVREHDGQTYGGRSYGYHLRQVVVALKEIDFASNLHREVAALHDVLEDTGATAAELRRNFGGEVASAVVQLSRSPEVGTRAFFERMDGVAFAVKLADRLCNLRALGRFPAEVPRDRSRRLPKYQSEMPVLRSRAAALGPRYLAAAALVAQELAAATRRLLFGLPSARG